MSEITEQTQSIEQTNESEHLNEQSNEIVEQQNETNDSHDQEQPDNSMEDENTKPALVSDEEISSDVAVSDEVQEQSSDPNEVQDQSSDRVIVESASSRPSSSHSESAQAAQSMVMMDADDGMMAEEEMVEVVENVESFGPVETKAEQSDEQPEAVGTTPAPTSAESVLEISEASVDASIVDVDASSNTEQTLSTVEAIISRPVTAQLQSARVKTPAISRPVTARPAEISTPAIGLPLTQSLEQSYNASLTAALARLAIVRTELKFPGLSISQSACLFVSLALLAERAGPNSEAEQQLQRFIETASLVKQLKQRGVYSVEEGVDNEDSRMIEHFASSCEAVGDGAAGFEILDKYFQNSFFNAQVCK